MAVAKDSEQELEFQPGAALALRATVVSIELGSEAVIDFGNYMSQVFIACVVLY